MVRAVVFLGPTMARDEAAGLVDAEFLPPAAQGDIYSAYEKFRPQVIGLIDGFFENKPAVWHKEILYVMAQGVHILGASSMGALRAAELHQFGMQGVGSIFEAYRDYRLEDDDEVAVIHGPADLGYPMLSEAMVNIRSTFMAAVNEAVICPETFSRLVVLAKETHYKERSYGRVLRELEGDKSVSHEIRALKIWLEDNRRDVKREDAAALLQQISRMQTEAPERKSVSYNFENTIFWKKSIMKPAPDG